MNRPAGAAATPLASANLPDLGRASLEELRAWSSGLPLPAPHQATPDDIRWLRRGGRKLAADPRAGARHLGERFLRLASICRKERARVLALLEAEAALCPGDVEVVAGVDEAGRGPLAGPVVAAAVVLKPGVVVPGLNDSKQVPEEIREELFDRVVEACLGYGVGMAGPGVIDRINILQATYVAMRRAVAKLGVRPGYVLVDGFPIPGLGLPQRGVIHGDAVCGSIAAASILAKVTRDRIMRRVAVRFPGYGFERNKGYSAREHWAGLERIGPCPAHRRSFLSESARQEELFGGLPRSETLESRDRDEIEAAGRRPAAEGGGSS